MSTPASNVIVQVYLPAISASLGWVTVAGLWRERPFAVLRWAPRSQPKTKWIPRVPATTPWQERD